MTTFLPNDELFENWYYRRDPTHVVFYKKKTFQHIGNQRNWQVFFPSENIVLFIKNNLNLITMCYEYSSKI